MTFSVRQHNPPVGKNRRMGRLVCNAQVFGLGPGGAFVGTAATLNVLVDLGFGVVEPSEGDDLPVCGHPGSLIPIEVPSHRIMCCPPGVTPRPACIAGVQVGHLLVPLRSIFILLVRLDAQGKTSTGQLQNRVRQARRAEIVWRRRRAPRRPGEAEIGRFGDHDAHRQKTLGDFVEERFSRVRFTVDP